MRTKLLPHKICDNVHQRLTPQAWRDPGTIDLESTRRPGAIRLKWCSLYMHVFSPWNSIFIISRHGFLSLVSSLATNIIIILEKKKKLIYTVTACAYLAGEQFRIMRR